MEIEKEYRYKVNETIIQNILKISDILEEKQHQIDLTLGYMGFDSLSKLSYVCCVRQKGEKIWMETKKRNGENSFNETKIDLKNFNSGVDFFKSIGMKPYLYMNRTRQILKYKGLKIFIDNIDMLGDYVEIEVQDVVNPKKIYKEFLELVGIDSNPQPLYGDIFKEKLKDEKFLNLFQEKSNEALKIIETI